MLRRWKGETVNINQQSNLANAKKDSYLVHLFMLVVSTKQMQLFLETSLGYILFCK